MERKLPDISKTEQDRQLNVKIRNHLENGPLAGRVALIILNTNNGIVTLTGRVERMNDIDAIVLEIKKVGGVKNVNNQLSAKNR